MQNGDENRNCRSSRPPSIQKNWHRDKVNTLRVLFFMIKKINSHASESINSMSVWIAWKLLWKFKKFHGICTHNYERLYFFWLATTEEKNNTWINQQIKFEKHKIHTSTNNNHPTTEECLNCRDREREKDGWMFEFFFLEVMRCRFHPSILNEKREREREKSCSIWFTEIGNDYSNPSYGYLFLLFFFFFGWEQLIDHLF